MKRCRIALVILLVFMLLFTSTVFAARREGINYVALGDSIAFGTGGTGGIGYTDLLNEHFSRKFGEGEYLNLSADGIRSKDLMFSLLDSNDTYGVQTEVQHADIITISIGGNDLLGPFLEELQIVIQKHYIISLEGTGLIINYPELLKDFEEWGQNPTKHIHFTEMMGKLSGKFPDIILSFQNNWRITIETIKTINPDAEIIVNTVYNPFKFSEPLEAFSKGPIMAINTSITGMSEFYGYQVVDVYTKFESYNNPQKLAVGDFSTLPMYFEDPDYQGEVPLHPTDMGYRFIVNMHKGLISK